MIREEKEKGKTCSEIFGLLETPLPSPSDCHGARPREGPGGEAGLQEAQDLTLASSGNVPFPMTPWDVSHLPSPSPPPRPSVEVQKRWGARREEGWHPGDTSAVAKSLIWVIQLRPALLKSGKPVFLPVMYHLETPTARISYVLTKKGRKQLVNVSQMAKLLASLSREGHPCRWLIILTFGFSSY